MAGVRRGAFTCVGWQVTLCDPIRQVTSSSSEAGFPPGRAISAFRILYNWNKTEWNKLNKTISSAVCWQVFYICCHFIVNEVLSEIFRYVMWTVTVISWTGLDWIGLDWTEQSLTPHPTQYRSFRRRSWQPITWLLLTKKQLKIIHDCSQYTYNNYFNRLIRKFWVQSRWFLQRTQCTDGNGTERENRLKVEQVKVKVKVN